MTLKRKALLLLMTSSLAEGAFEAWAMLHPAQSQNFLFPYVVASFFLTLFLVFVWLRGDEQDYRYRRSAAMNIGIVALGLVFLPVYLIRSRPKGKRLKAIGLLLACFFGMYACLVAGYIAMALGSGARFN
ncbi:MAG TPA: hypothetical protein VGH80_04940 [Xanthomonadaceae bacterium]